MSDSNRPAYLEDLFDQSELHFNNMNAQLNLIDIAGSARSIRDSLISPDGWVQVLGAERFGSRQYASRQLHDLGSEAILPMYRGLSSTDPEIRDRCRKGLAKYSPALDLDNFSLLKGRDASLQMIEGVVGNQVAYEGLKAALGKFPDKDVPAAERKAIDDYFDKVSNPYPNGLSNAGALYALKRLVQDPAGNYLTFSLRQDDSFESLPAVSIDAELGKLLNAAKKFPDLVRRDLFILRAAELLPGHSSRPQGTWTEAEESFLGKLPAKRRQDFETALNRYREFERGTDYEEFRRDLREYANTENGDRLIMRLRAKPYLLEEPVILLSLRQRAPQLLGTIARTLTTSQRERFTSRINHIAQVYPGEEK